MDLLNLKKNDILDLSKKEPGLNNIVLACGWDVAKKGLFSFGSADVDLDLSALLLGDDYRIIGKEGIVYFNNQRAQGIYLHEDNRTGEGDGDDEKISITLSDLPANCKAIVFSINIYQAKVRKQDFSKVKNAYIRVLNADKGYSEMCRYNLSEDGKNATSLIFAQLEKVNNAWQFKAIGNLENGDLNSIIDKFK
ncbi:MAG: TerD family protein [Peptostreptococcaceae bacterium]